MKWKDTLHDIPKNRSARPARDKYGEDLVCVRYKHDKQNDLTMITVEIIADVQLWQRNVKTIPKNKFVELSIRYGEVDPGRKVRSLGATWNKAEKAWELPFKVLQAPGLEKRIADEI